MNDRVETSHESKTNALFELLRSLWPAAHVVAPEPSHLEGNVSSVEMRRRDVTVEHPLFGL
jgi:hypothetical protein